MKTLYYNLKNYNCINILPLADLHVGSPECDVEYIKKLIFNAVEDKNTFVILNGDLVDMALPGTPGNQYTATMTPDRQIKTVTDLLHPLSDVGRILCVLNGNHEERLLKASGVSVASQIAKSLGIPMAYSNDTALIFLDVGDVSYTIYATHGAGCTCREVSSKINKLSSLADVLDADLYLSAHSHLPATFREGFLRIDRTKGQVEKIDHLFVNCASALEWGGYAEQQGYNPPANVYPVVSLNGTRREMRVLA